MTKTEIWLRLMHQPIHNISNNNLPSCKDLRSGILLVAIMGGYMNRKHDPLPGHEIMWRGYARLQMRAIAYEELGAIYDLVESPPPEQ